MQIKKGVYELPQARIVAKNTLQNSNHMDIMRYSIYQASVNT